MTVGNGIGLSDFREIVFYPSFGFGATGFGRAGLGFVLGLTGTDLGFAIGAGGVGYWLTVAEVIFWGMIS